MRLQRPVFIRLDQEGGNTDDALPSTGGTYVLICRLSRSQTITIGKLGKFQFEAGYYLYIGSAFGPGGIQARVNRHIKKQKKLRWHIDYLRKNSDLDQVWYSVKKERQECFWSQQLLTTAGFHIPVQRFGASDCSCPTHLYHTAACPQSSIKDYLRCLLTGKL